MFSFLLGTYLGVEWPDHMIGVHLQLGNFGTVFQNDCIILHSYSSI